MTTPLPEGCSVEDSEYDHLSALAGRLVHLMLKLLAWANTSADRLALPPRGPGQYEILEATRYFRVERALRWARALKDVFSGKFRLAPSHRQAARAPCAPPEGPAERRGPSPHPFGTSYATLREIFRTRPIREIAVRICCDLELKPGTALWPVDVMRLNQTPAEWSAENYPPDPEPRAPRLALDWCSEPKPEFPDALEADIPPPDPAPPPEIHSSA